jgi:hypothetical protein
MEIAGGVGQMHGDDAVLGFSDSAAPLPLDARSLVAFFHVAGFVDHANRIATSVVPDAGLYGFLCHGN